MTKSMTGFARASATLGGETIAIEISSVNHRFLDTSIRLPHHWTMVEPTLRAVVKKHVARGKLNIVVRHERGVSASPPIRLDVERAKQYIEASNELMHLMRSTDVVSVDTLITLDGVITSIEEEPDKEETERVLSSALEDALQQLNDMRSHEGNALATALAEHLQALEATLGRVEAQAPALVKAYQDRLWQRMEEINAETGLKEERLAMEVAVMAERMDVNEELVRLKAHIAHARDILNTDGPVGRDLNFLTQEMQREVNTLGAKLRGVDTCRDIIEMKGEVEKIREQIQNVE